MGCDIHLHTEIKVNGVWHHYSQPRINRSYYLFCKLAGARGPIAGVSPIAEPRGIPSDISFTTALDYEHANRCYDPHHQSWIIGAELSLVIEWYDEIVRADRKARGDVNSFVSFEHESFGYFFGNGWQPWPSERGRAYPAGIEDVRAVFWFDN